MERKYDYFEKLNDFEAKEEVDRILEEKKAKIINSQDSLLTTGRTIYVSEQGDDTNDGLSPDTPKKTLKHVRNMTEKGDKILLKRGEMFRGFLCALDDVSIGAYGKGRKPIINGSEMNYAKPELWEETEHKNVYVCTKSFQNVGVILFNPTYEYGKYDEHYGDMWFKSVEELHNEYDFYFDLNKNKLYVYCDKNPGEKYEDIEIGDNFCLIIGDGKNVTIDNLWLMVAGIHGVSMHKCESRTITNCVFSWIGGSMYWIRELPDNQGKRYVRYGNAVEIFGPCENLTVKNCWTYQIFDTGLTFQNSYHCYDRPCIHKNITFQDNIIEYSFWGIEIYNFGYHKDGKPIDTRDCTDVTIDNNILTKAGYGWGCSEKNRYYPARALSCGVTTGKIENFSVTNNIFNDTIGHVIFVRECYHSKAFFDGNVVGEHKGKNEAGPIVPNHNGTARDFANKILGDKNVKGFFLPKNI